MILVAGSREGRVERLLGGLGRIGHSIVSATPDAAAAKLGSASGATFVFGPGSDRDAMARCAEWKATTPRGGLRVLVLSSIGAHPDAPVEGLRRLWGLEEQCRAIDAPVLTLRLAPLLGPETPMWLRLRTWPRLPRRGRALVTPVIETDVVGTIARALETESLWQGWFEVAGHEVLSLADLVELARRGGKRLPAGSGAWEPTLEELEAQRLTEAGPWIEHFGVRAGRVTDAAARWAA